MEAGKTLMNESFPYLLFKVGRNIYGINSKSVLGIEELGEITEVMDYNPFICGGIFYQDKFINLINTRKMFGLDSQIDEFEKTVKPEQRIEEHEFWVSSLERSVNENTYFILTDDHHLCNFGKWYYSFKSDNNVLNYHLKAIEEPHKAIHNTAKIVKELMGQGNHSAAAAEIKKMRETTYKKTIGILSSLRQIVADSLKEMYIVVKYKEYTRGLIVDDIVDVEHLEDRIWVPDTIGAPEYIQFIGLRKKDKSTVIAIDNSIINL